MADTVKKSRIVSEDDDNLEEALLEEFNMRLKNCMSKDDLKSADDEYQEDLFYENVSSNTRPIPISGIASNDFLLSERQHFYDSPVNLKNGSEERQNVQNTDEETENIYETLPEYRENEKTESTDQYVEVSTPEDVKPNLILDLSPKIEIEHVCYEDLDETEASEDGYEIVEQEGVDKPSFTVKTTDFSELRSPEDNAKSVKDRMFLATDDAATLLFTQTVTSPMLTPSEENIDFLKGFQRENTHSDATASNESPPKEDITKTSEENSTSDISADISEPLANELVEENKEIKSEENIYENSEFLKQNAGNMYENLKAENIYENLKDVKRAVEELEELEEHIYQDIDECIKGDDTGDKKEIASVDEEEEVYESVGEVYENENIPDAVMVENSLYNPEITQREDRQHAEININLDKTGYDDDMKQGDIERHYETIEENVITEKCPEPIGKHSEMIESQTETIMSHPESNIETVESNTDDSLESKTKETYTEFIHHSKTESNYYEKYTEIVSKTSTNSEISNREKDTESVPAEIVKNLKNQFLKSGAEVVATTKKK
ncbi:hypothetical protein JTB14_020459 [Gonioctena quinquepunctata]|nr:hypothetical protein JTB14_020459 [Gonioctena quinquepunctata]